MVSSAAQKINSRVSLWQRSSTLIHWLAETFSALANGLRACELCLINIISWESAGHMKMEEHVAGSLLVKFLPAECNLRLLVKEWYITCNVSKQRIIIICSSVVLFQLTELPLGAGHENYY